MPKDNFLRARLSEDKQKELDLIVEELQAEQPAGNVTASSIARHALELYIDKHLNVNAGKKVYVEIDVDGVTTGSIKHVVDQLISCMDKAESLQEIEAQRILNSLAVPLSREELRRLTERK